MSEMYPSLHECKSSDLKSTVPCPVYRHSITRKLFYREPGDTYFTIFQEQPSQATAAFWQPFPDNSHIPVQQSDERMNKDNTSHVASPKSKEPKQK